MVVVSNTAPSLAPSVYIIVIVHIGFSKNSTG
nr:MAG TPA: hypothetical protein [Caudoviricetes sp.]